MIMLATELNRAIIQEVQEIAMSVHSKRRQIWFFGYCIITGRHCLNQGERGSLTSPFLFLEELLALQ